MGENTGRGSDNLLWLVKQTMCVLNCKTGGPYPLAVMPTPPRAFVCFNNKSLQQMEGQCARQK